LIGWLTQPEQTPAAMPAFFVWSILTTTVTIRESG
jgi:hypothetical protein